MKIIIIYELRSFDREKRGERWSGGKWIRSKVHKRKHKCRMKGIRWFGSKLVSSGGCTKQNRRKKSTGGICFRFEISRISDQRHLVNFVKFEATTTKNKNFRSKGLRNFRGTFPENKYDCAKVEIQSFLEHPKFSKSVQ